MILSADPYLVSAPSTPTGDLDAFMAQLGYDYTVGLEASAKLPVGALLAYPNPATDDLTIAGLEVGENASLQVLDVLGRPVMQSVKVTSSKVTLDTSYLPPGSYFVRLSAADAIRYCGFLKQ